MSVVWKYDLPDRVTRRQMPAGAKPIHVAEQHGMIRLWAIVEPDNPPEERGFIVVGTGHEFDPAGLQLIGSLLTPGGTFVFHVFERVSPAVPGDSQER